MTEVAALAPSWTTVCTQDDVTPYRGVCALVEGRQVAVFRTADDWFAVDNYDPCSDANVLSRGIVGDIDGVTCVASPIYKQHFCLRTGRCLEDDSACVPVYSVRIVQEHVEISLAPGAG